MATIAYPLINGVRYDFSSINLTLASVPLAGFKSIDYSLNMDPGEVWGASSRMLGTTRGQLKCSGSITILKEEWTAFLATLAPLGVSLGTVFFGVSLVYADAESILISQDELVGCRIKVISNSHSSGNEGLSVKLDLFITDIIQNGVSMTLTPPAPLIGAGV